MYRYATINAAKKSTAEITAHCRIRLSESKTQAAHCTASGTVCKTESTTGVYKRCNQTVSSMIGLLSDSCGLVKILSLGR